MTSRAALVVLLLLLVELREAPEQLRAARRDPGCRRGAPRRRPSPSASRGARGRPPRASRRARRVRGRRCSRHRRSPRATATVASCVRDPSRSASRVLSNARSSSPSSLLEDAAERVMERGPALAASCPSRSSSRSWSATRSPQRAAPRRGARARRSPARRGRARGSARTRRSRVAIAERLVADARLLVEDRALRRRRLGATSARRFRTSSSGSCSPRLLVERSSATSARVLVGAQLERPPVVLLRERGVATASSARARRCAA